MIYLFTQTGYISENKINIYYTHYFYDNDRKEFVFIQGADRILRGNDILYDYVIPDYEVYSHRFYLSEHELIFVNHKELYGTTEVIISVCEKYLLSRILDKI